MDPSLTQNQKSERQVGNYILEQKLGEGGMAEVWKGRHQVLATYVAIKFLSAGYAGIADVEQRFLGEGKKQARLSHPNIVSAYDFIYADGRSYLIMKFVEGESLDELLFRLQAPMPLPQVLAISTDVLHALQYAHSQNVVHRDIKPSNIMIEKNERALVLDFGVAMVVGEKRVTRVGMAIGTPHYMSPEQILGSADIDRRADIYSFGCVLYQMLTGKAPFEAAEGEDDTEFVIQDKHVRQQPVPLRQWNPYIPEYIERVVLKCLEKKPAERFSSCQDLLTALTTPTAVVESATATRGAIESPPAASRTLIETTPTSPAPPKTPDAARPARQTLVETSPRSAKTVIETGVPIPQSAILSTPASTPPPVKPGGTVVAPPQSPKVSTPVSLPPKKTGDLTVLWVLATALVSASLVGGTYWYLHRSKPEPAPIVNPNPAPAPAPEPGPQVSKPSPGQIDAPKPEEPQPQPPVNPPITKPDSPAPKAGPDRPVDTTPNPPVSHTPPPDANPTPVQPTPTPAPATPAPEPKVTPPARHYAHEGDLVWSGQVDKNQVIQISTSGANIGNISGDQFPGDGVPIEVSINNNKFAVVSQPNPINQFSQIWLRSTMKGNVVVVIHWKVLPNE